MQLQLQSLTTASWEAITQSTAMITSLINKVADLDHSRHPGPTLSRKWWIWASLLPHLLMRRRSQLWLQLLVQHQEETDPEGIRNYLTILNQIVHQYLALIHHAMTNPPSASQISVAHAINLMSRQAVGTWQGFLHLWSPSFRGNSVT